MKDSFAYQKGLNITKADLVDRGIFVISYGQIHSKTNTGTYIGDGLLRFVPESFLESNAECLLKKNDFVFADTSEDLDGLGNCAFCDRDDVIFAGYHTIVLRPTQTQEWKYCAYLFKTDAWRSQFRSLAFGIKVFSLSQRLLNVCTFVLPPLPEQQRIAAFLDERCAKIDGMIAEAKASIEDYKKWKQSIIFEAVTGKHEKNLKPSGVDWIGDVPEGWKACKVLHALSMPITDGPHTTPELYDDGIPFVSAEAVSAGNGHIDFNHIRGYISEAFYRECSEKYVPALDDIYMIKSGATTGKVAIVDTDRIFTIWSPLAVFRSDKDKTYPKFLFYFLQSPIFQKQVELAWSFGTQQNIGMRMLEGLKIVLPPLLEQRRIAAFLDEKCAAIDKLVGEKEALIADLEAYKKSLIFETVTGKREIA